MGITINKIECNQDYLKIDSEIFDKLHKYEIEQTLISISKKDLQNLLKNSNDEYEKEVFESMIKQIGKDEAGDFLIG